MNDATNLADLLQIMDMSESDVSRNIQQLTALRGAIQQAMHASKSNQHPFQTKINHLDDLIMIMKAWQQASH